MRPPLLANPELPGAKSLVLMVDWLSLNFEPLVGFQFDLNLSTKTNFYFLMNIKAIKIKNQQ